MSSLIRACNADPSGAEVSWKPAETPELSADLLSLDDPSPTIPSAPTPAPTPAQPLDLLQGQPQWSECTTLGSVLSDLSEDPLLGISFE